MNSEGVAADRRRAVRRSRQVLLIVGTMEVPDCFVHAIQRHFRTVRVVHVPDLGAAAEDLRDPVSLVLIDSALFDDLRPSLGEMKLAHPAATFAIVHNERSRPISIAEVLALPQLSGILPMDVKLDLWLSILQVFMRGGTYLPSFLVAASARWQERAANPAERPEPKGRVRGRLKGLTEREFEILELVSRGLQNKLIAGRLSLSENTIKIHLHNIITKLGAHNRTEAACLFRDHAVVARAPFGEGPPPTQRQ